MAHCGIDPGFSGGISIILEQEEIVYKMPIFKVEKKVKGKKRYKKFYDLLEIREIFKKHLNKNSIFILEKASPHRGEGAVSSFSSGRGYGSLEGLIIGLFNKAPIEVTPQAWKKCFPELINDEICDKKEEIKQLRVYGKALPVKTIKEKKAKKENDKQIDKLNRQVKSIAKTNARLLAMKLYPKLADNFVKVGSDGMAESLLIALSLCKKDMSK